MKTERDGAILRISTKKHSRIKADDVYAFFQQLATMVQAGMAITDALEMAAKQCQSTQLSEMVEAMSERMQAGSALHAAAADYPRIFEPHWIQVIRTGEISGQLGPLLAHLAQHMKEARESRSKVVSALIYPASIFCVAVAALVIMLWFVVPTFTQFFNDTGAALPGITVFVVSLSGLLESYGIFAVAAVAVAAFAIRHWIKTEAGGRTFTTWLIAAPVFGEVVVQSCMEKFATNLALLLRAGMPLLDALYAMNGVFESNPIYLDGLAHVQRRVASGRSLAQGLEEGGLFTPMLMNLVHVGEESGQLVQVLEQVSSYYKQRVAALATRITSMVEPAIILGMGLMVAVILTAIYLPMFSMGGAVK